jgi:hypothetical protein
LPSPTSPQAPPPTMNGIDQMNSKCLKPAVASAIGADLETGRVTP